MTRPPEIVARPTRPSRRRDRLPAHPRHRRRDDRRHRAAGRAARARLGPARLDRGSARRLGGQSGGVARLVWRRASISSPASARPTSKARQRASKRSASRRISSAIERMRPGGSSRSSTRTANAASSPIAAPTKRSKPRDIPDALIEGAALIHLSGYSFFAPSPRAAVLDVDAARGSQAHQRRSGVGGILARGRGGQISRLDARRGDPVPQRRGSGNSRRLRRSRNPMRATCRALSAGRHQARRGRRRGGCRRAALAGRTRRRSRRSTRPARATPSSPPFLASGFPARTSSPRSSAPPPPARRRRQASAEGRSGRAFAPTDRSNRFF